MTHLLLAIAYLTSGTVLLLALAAHNSLTLSRFKFCKDIETKAHIAGSLVLSSAYFFYYLI